MFEVSVPYRSRCSTMFMWKFFVCSCVWYWSRCRSWCHDTRRTHFHRVTASRQHSSRNGRGWLPRRVSQVVAHPPSVKHTELYRPSPPPHLQVELLIGEPVVVINMRSTDPPIGSIECSWWRGGVGGVAGGKGSITWYRRPSALLLHVI